MVREGTFKAPSDLCLQAHILPTEYKGSWDRLQQLIRDFKPISVVNFGLSAEAAGFTLERIAKNEISAKRPDNTGTMPLPTAICSEGRPEIASGLPLRELFEGLTAAVLPVHFSDDAGGYVCNHLFYQCLNCDLPERPRASGFIHIPFLNTQRDRLEESREIVEGLDALTRDELIRGVEVILKVIGDKVDL